MNRTEAPALKSNEIAYLTGDATWPLARLRVTPVETDEAARINEPNAPPMPARIVVCLSASLIDETGAVERVAGKLLLGPESRHTMQFDADAPLDPDGWIDECAEQVISGLIRQARGISSAAAAGLLN